MRSFGIKTRLYTTSPAVPSDSQIHPTEPGLPGFAYTSKGPTHVAMTHVAMTHVAMRLGHQLDTKSSTEEKNNL